MTTHKVHLLNLDHKQLLLVLKKSFHFNKQENVYFKKIHINLIKLDISLKKTFIRISVKLGRSQL